MHAPPILDFSTNEFVLMLGVYRFSVDVNYLFDKSNTLVLALYTSELIIIGSLKQFMLWCGKSLTSVVDMKEKGGS
jgi:hypothetical protein